MSPGIFKAMVTAGLIIGSLFLILAISNAIDRLVLG
jgi:hypothetical protein